MTALEPAWDALHAALRAGGDRPHKDWTAAGAIGAECVTEMAR